MNRLEVLNGCVLDELPKIARGSVQAVVTSPPYWGLRDYGIEPSHWPAIEFFLVAGLPLMKVGACDCVLGLESDPWTFVAHVVHVFRKVRPVLREDGTCWVNFGDSYAGSGKGAWDNKNVGQKESYRPDPDSPQCKIPKVPLGLKQKELVGIPWRVAFALQADGWYLRSDIIWSKPNPMPESVTDRPTKAHEYIFLLSKSKDYYFDAEAVKERVSPATHARLSQDLAGQVGSFRANGGNKTNGPMKAVVAGSTRKLWDGQPKPNGPNSRMVKARNIGAEDSKPNPSSGNIRPKQNSSYETAMALTVSSRNIRSVWTVASAPYKGVHFATYPPALIRPAILAGTSARGCCANCGAPYERIVEESFTNHDGDTETKYEEKSTAGRLATLRQAARERGEEYSSVKKTIGWRETCECKADVVPCVVLDPFGGSGTTAQVAIENGRRAIVTERNPEYIELIRQRCHLTPGLPLA